MQRLIVKKKDTIVTAQEARLDQSQVNLGPSPVTRPVVNAACRDVHRVDYAAYAECCGGLAWTQNTLFCGRSQCYSTPIDPTSNQPVQPNPVRLDPTRYSRPVNPPRASSSSFLHEREPRAAQSNAIGEREWPRGAATLGLKQSHGGRRREGRARALSDSGERGARAATQGERESRARGGTSSVEHEELR